MKTKENFSNLPKIEQIYKLFHEGKELFTRRQDIFIIKLFSLHELYVEVWYCTGKNIIEDIIVVDDDEILELYKSEFKITELINK